MKIKLFKLFLITFALFLFAKPAQSTSLTDYAENVIVDHVFRGTAYSNSAPANYHIALYTVTCSDSTAGTEVVGGSYARVALARSQAAWYSTGAGANGVGAASIASAGVSGTIGNAGAVTYPAATADWGTVVSWGIIDTSTGAGNLIVCAALTTSRTITNGSTPSFAAGALTVQMDN